MMRSMRRSVLVGLVVALAGCGGSAAHVGSTATTAAAPPGPGKVLYAGGPWAVVLDGGKATAYHRVGGAWHADRAGAVQIRVLGPAPGSTAPRLPQVAVELSASAPLVESGLWVDGKELLEKGGGLSPKKGTIYGAPAARLTPGTHRAVAYSRTDTHASAITWTFRV